MLSFVMAQDLLLVAAISVTKDISCNVDNKDRVNMSVRRIPETRFQAKPTLRLCERWWCTDASVFSTVYVFQIHKKEVLK
jgi:hypothetical protein